tara:strand:- start:667 stop:849 length:183 start_codon:yes stop_codon:yes gene_type:complete
MQVGDMSIMVGCPDLVKLLELLICQYFNALGVRIWFRKFDVPVEGRAKLVTDSKIDDSTQ